MTPVDIPDHLFVAIDHVGVAVADLDEAMAFYRELGLEIVGTQSFMLGEERQRDLVMSIALA